jgi:hypothetical protein
MPTAVSSSSKPDQVPQVAAESIKPPIHQRLYLAPPRAESDHRAQVATSSCRIRRPFIDPDAAKDPFFRRSESSFWGVTRNLSTSFTRGLR